MSCLFCGSGSEAEFTAEINIHFHGLENIDNPGVLLFSKLIVCLDCGMSRFSTPEIELSQLAKRPAASEPKTWRRRADDVVLRRRITLAT